MHYTRMTFQSVMKWWRDRQRQHDIRVFSAVKPEASGTPLYSRCDDEDDPVARNMREILGDEAFVEQQRLVKQRDNFEAGLSNAVEAGLSGKEMAEFLNGHAFLWKYLYQNAERDRQFTAMIERALILCANYVPEHWYRAITDVDENREHHAALRRKYDI
jgi:hypothetical protein